MCQFIPQYIYQNLLEKGDEEQKSFAAEILEKIKSFAYDPAEILAAHLKRLAEVKGKVEVEEEGPNRIIYDAENKMTLPGKKVRGEGEESNGDVAVDKAYDFSGKTWDFYYNVLKRDSIDGNGCELRNVVHYGKNFGNAFWTSREMVFGDGDGKIFNSFLLLDVAAHEQTHGVVETSAGLAYYAQSGALNESFADVFGSLVTQYSRNQTAEEASWLIGEGLFCKNINARALRDMRNPGTAYSDTVIGSDNQTDHMDKYDYSPGDNQMVHCNSGIPNKAFATASLILGGKAWETTGRIWYKTLTTKLRSKSQFQDCADGTVQDAADLFGKNSKEKKAVVEGWKAVGIKVK